MDGRREEGVHTLARLTGLGPGLRAMAAAARHLREWSAEIRSLALRGRGFLLLFYFFGVLAGKLGFLPTLAAALPM